MMVLNLGTWSWLALFLAGWSVVSFAIAFWLGRAIRMSDLALQSPSVEEEPSRVRSHSGFMKSIRPRTSHIEAKQPQHGTGTEG